MKSIRARFARSPRTNPKRTGPSRRAKSRSRARHLLFEPLETRWLLAAGDLDLSFDGDGKVLLSPEGPSVISGAKSVVADGDKLIVTGAVGFGSTATIVRLNSDGSLDNTFDGDGIVQNRQLFNFTSPTVVSVGNERKLLVGSANSVPEFAMIRYNDDGSIDTTFGTGGVATLGSASDNLYLESFAVDANGNITAAGRGFKKTAPFNTRVVVARWNANGTPDLSFGSGGIQVSDFTASGHPNAGAFAVTVDGLGRTVVTGYGGTFIAPNVLTVRYDANGNLDGTFDTDGLVTSSFGDQSANGRAVTTDAENRVTIASESPSGFRIARYTAAGALDSSFGTQGTTTLLIDDANGTPVAGLRAWDMKADEQGRLLVAGEAFFTNDTRAFDFALARFTANGTLDSSFGMGGYIVTDLQQDSDKAFSLAIDAQDRIVLAGISSPPADIQENTPGISSFAVVRYLGDPPAANQPPVANDDAIFLFEDTPRELTIEPGIPFWGNDTDPDDNYPLTAHIDSGPSFGTLDPPGSATNPGPFFVYTPGMNYFGNDFITYRSEDARGAFSNTATVTLTVFSERDPTIEANVNENSLDAFDLASLFPPRAPISFELVSATIPGSGSSDLFEIAGGVLKFKTPPDFESPQGIDGGNTYEILVGLRNDPAPADVQAFRIHVLDVNETPSPVVSFSSDLQQVAEDVGEVTITVNLSAPSDSPVTVPFTIAGTATLATLDAPNDFSFTPSPITIPPATLSAVVVVTVNDDSNVEATETVILNLGTAVGATLGAITTHTVRITDNDQVAGRTTAEDTPLVLDQLPLPVNVPATNTNVKVTLSVAHGTLNGGQRSFMQSQPHVQLVIALLNGMATYTPDPNFHGDDTLTVVLENLDDATAEQASYTVPITVTPVNDAPVANDATFLSRENLSVSESLTSFDVDGDLLTYSLLTGPGNSPTHGKVVQDVIGGAVFTYTPSVDFAGSDTFRFRVDDGNGLISEATVTVTVQATIAPIAGRVVFDVNGNGIADPTEPGIANTEVTLSAADATFPPLTQRTNEYGEYDFRGLLPRNDYRLSAAQPVLATSTPGAPEDFQFAMPVINPQPPVVPRDFAEREITDAAAINDEVARWASDPLIPGLIFAYGGAATDWWAFGAGWVGYKNLSVTIAADGSMITLFALRTTKSDDVSVEQVISVIDNPSVVLHRFGDTQFVVNLRGTAEDFGLPKASLPGWAVLGSKADDVLTVNYASGLFWLNDGAKKRLSGIETIFFDGGTGTGKNTVAINGSPEIDIYYKPDSARPESNVPRDVCGEPLIDPGVNRAEGEPPSSAIPGFRNSGFGGGGGLGGGGLGGGLAGLLGIARPVTMPDAYDGIMVNYPPPAIDPDPEWDKCELARGLAAGNIDARNIHPVDVSQLQALHVQPSGIGSQILISDDFNTASTVDQEAPGSVAAWKVSGTSGGLGFEQAHLFRSQSLILDTSTIDGDDTFTFTAETNVLGNQFSIKSGNGSDMVVFDKSVRLADLPIGQIDLGTGSNRLRFNAAGNVLDMTAFSPGKLLGIQTLDFGNGGGNNVKLSAAIVQEMVGSGGKLELLTSPTDSVDFGAGWRVVGTTVRDNQFFRILEQAGIRIETAGGSAWQNPLLALDVNRDGTVSPADALICINELNAPRFSDVTRLLRDAGLFIPFPMLFVDVDGDGFIAPLDVLLVFNHLNRPPGSSEGLPTSEAIVSDYEISTNDAATELLVFAPPMLSNNPDITATHSRGQLKSWDAATSSEVQDAADAKAKGWANRERLLDEAVVDELCELTVLDDLLANLLTP